MALTNDQQNASNDFLDFMVDPTKKYMVIEGSAGTGKSFMIKHIIETYEAQYKAHCMLLQQQPISRPVYVTATTNKAASVLNDFLVNYSSQNLITTGGKVRTIHSLLGLKITNNRHTGKTYLSSTKSTRDFFNEIIIIDEASFIDDDLFKLLDKLTPVGCKILFIGDPYQLTPVNQKESIMHSLKCDRSILTDVVRNGGNILNVCMLFKEAVITGQLPSIPFDNTEVIRVDGPDFKKLIDQEYSQSNWTARDTDHCKVLSWTNRRVQEYNSYIRNIKSLPEHFTDGETVITNNPIINSKTFAPVDSKVTIETIHSHHEKDSGMDGYWINLCEGTSSFMPKNFSQQKAYLNKLAKNEDWPRYFNVKEHWFDLRSPYASSIHKSQGSTYDLVFIDLYDIMTNWNMDQIARLLYVAFSRAAKQVICYGNI
jgi:hypothetical protein